MMMRIPATTFALIMTTGLAANGAVKSDSERIAELERKVDILTRELERDRFGDIIVPVGDSAYGLGPAASKIYAKDEGLSIGGYGEALYQNFRDDEQADEADFLRAVFYFGYKYNEQWVFNSEIEVEHASTDKEGSVSVEFAYLDYLRSPALNLRAGLVLIPVGMVNELHEPAVFLGARRPEIESRIIPTTWRENGAGLFGEIVEGLDYKVYVVNGMRAEKFTPKGLRGGRQKGSEAMAEDFAFVVRIDYRPVTGWSAGASVYHGDSGQDLDLDVETSLWEVHTEARVGGLQLRGLITGAELDDVAELNRLVGGADEEGNPVADADIDSIGEELLGWYLEAGFDLFSLAGEGTGEQSLTPFLRYSQFDTQDEVPAGFQRSGKYDVEVVTLGVQYQPIDEIVFKADYQLYDDEADSLDNQFNLALGYVF